MTKEQIKKKLDEIFAEDKKYEVKLMDHIDFDLGYFSIGSAWLAGKISEKFGINMLPGKVHESDTVKDLVSSIEKEIENLPSNRLPKHAEEIDALGVDSEGEFD